MTYNLIVGRTKWIYCKMLKLHVQP